MSVINLNTINTICVTGKSVYRYMEINDDNNTLSVRHTALDVLAANVTDNYSCHCWIKDKASVIVCTEDGDILLTDYEGRYLAHIKRLNDVIECIQPMSFGFVVAGKSKFWLF